MTQQWLMKSELAPLYLVASEKGLRGIFWEKQPVPMAPSLSGDEASTKVLSKAVRQITDYLKGRRRDFDLPFDVEGTDFQKKVWRALARIPYGETRSYSDIARQIKNPKAVRAVGSANGKNPLCLIVPCHRVISADGSLGGYAGGLEVKRRLLGLEGLRF